MKNLANKVVLVTGAASGIGKAIAQRFNAEGAKVFVSDFSEKAGAEVAESINGYFIRTDVSDPASVEAAVAYAVKTAGRLDIMVNCAGITMEPTLIHEMPFDNWDRVIAINLTGVMHGMKFALAQFLKQGDGGNIVNISSVGGLVAMATTGSYAAAKAGVANLTRVGAIEYGDRGIRVNAVAPTSVRTSLSQSYIESSEDPVATKKMLESMNPLTGMAEPEDIAAAVAFLASDDARFVSGIILPVDGGYTAR